MTQIGVGAVANDGTGDTDRTSFQKSNRSMRDCFNVMYYGAKGDRTTDDTVAIQAAIDAAFTGNPADPGFAGPVYIPAGYYNTSAPLTVHPATRIIGALEGASLDRDFPYCGIIGTGAYSVFDLQSNNNVCLSGFAIAGPGAVAGSRGIDATSVTKLALSNLFVGGPAGGGFGEEGIRIQASGSLTIKDVWANNCVLVTSGRSAYIGAIDISGTDCWADNVFATASISGVLTVNQGAGLYGSGWIAGLVLRGMSASFIYKCYAELSQNGIVLTGANSQNNRLVGCRASHNMGNGFVFDDSPGGGHQVIGGYAYNNSLAVSNTYDGFVVKSAGNSFIGNMIAAASAGVTRHGFTDTSSGSGENDGTTYVGNKLYGTGVAGVLYNLLGAGVNAYGVTQAHRASTDRGDNSITIQAGVDADLQVFNTPLTAARTVALSTTGAWSGARFRISRSTAATGAFGLVVTVGGVPFNLSPGQSIDVEYIWALSGWQVVGFGSSTPNTVQTPTEAVLVSGVDCRAGNIVIPAVLTAARVVGAPLNPTTGQRITFTLIQDGTGARAVTWNAVFKVSWSDTGNTLNKRSSISFNYDGTNWNQDGAQTPYV